MKACDSSQTQRVHTDFQIVFCQNFINPFGPLAPTKTSFAVVSKLGQFESIHCEKELYTKYRLMSCQERNGSHVISVRRARLLVLCFNQS